MAKLAPRDLAQVLGKLPIQRNENVIVGFEGADDAGVFRLRNDLAIVQTVDFFTPVVDDPYNYGRIAAVNALNDVYAMGGVPVSALSIVCFPQIGDMDLLSEILAGGQAAMNEDGVVVLGGHSVDDPEIKIGYSVTGTIHPEKVVTNSGARVGDLLILTKPLGTGAINTAIKKGIASDEIIRQVVATMTLSAADASKAMVKLAANACTDITGFGLLGHAYEMAKGSRVTLNIASKDVMLLPKVLEFIEEGMLTRGDVNNREYVGDQIRFSADVHRFMRSALFDPQTAGGLLISLPRENAAVFVGEIEHSRVIGAVEPLKDVLIEVS